MRLVVGCGPDYVRRQQDDVLLDFKSSFNPDVVFNIATGKRWPFDRETFDEVEAFHVMEHIEGFKNYRKAMEEMYRILKTGGLLHIKVPYWKHHSAVETADHVRFFNENSFHDWQTTNPYLEEMEYKVKFEQVLERVNFDQGGEACEVEVIMKKVI